MFLTNISIEHEERSKTMSGFIGSCINKYTNNIIIGVKANKCLMFIFENKRLVLNLDT